MFADKDQSLISTITFLPAAVAADDHTHIVGMYAEGKDNVLASLLLVHRYVIGMIHDGCSDINKDLLQALHNSRALRNQMPAFLSSAFTVGVGCAPLPSHFLAASS